MSAHRIIEAVNIFANSHYGLFSGLENSTPYQLQFNSFKYGRDQVLSRNFHSFCAIGTSVRIVENGVTTDDNRFRNEYIGRAITAQVLVKFAQLIGVRERIDIRTNLTSRQISLIDDFFQPICMADFT